MIVIQVGDQHADTSTPRSRKDDYWSAIQKKLLEIRALASGLECYDRVVTVFVGDLINRQQGHLVHYRLVNWLIDYFGLYKEKPLLILGNHDILSRPDHWERQPIGAIIKSGSVQHLDGKNPIVLKDTMGLSVAFTGTPFYYQIDEDKKGYNVPRVPSDFHFHVAHGALGPEPLKPFGGYTWPDEITFGGDHVLVGHMHEDFGVFYPTHKRFSISNFGSIARGSVAAFNLNRDAQVGIFEVSQKGMRCTPDSWKIDDFQKLELSPERNVDVHWMKHKLSCALPADQVFYLEEIQRKKLHQEDMAKLAQTFQTQTESGFELIAPQILLEAWLTNKTLSPRATDLIRAFVSKAQQEFM